MTKNIIIHISGFPGSGKTTLGEKLQKLYKNIIVYETDSFIQRYTKEGKQLLKIKKDILNNKKTNKDYRDLWKKTIKNKIDEFISKYNNKIIVFVGSLDNWAPRNTIYNINANYKFVLDIPLNELMKRFYLRISKEESENYWNNLSKGMFSIIGSENMIGELKKYNEWHKKHNYIFLDDKDIINKIKYIFLQHNN